MPKQWKYRIVLRALLLCACVVAAGSCNRPQGEAVSFVPDGDEVGAALERFSQGGGRVFVNGLGASWLVGQRELAAWMVVRLEDADRMRAGADPAFWRSLDRAHRFDVVAILGEPGDAGALVRHLRDSPDWQLAWVGGSGCLFTRAFAGGESDQPVVGQPSARTAHWLLELGLTDKARSMVHKITGTGDKQHVAFLTAWLAAEDKDWVAVLAQTQELRDSSLAEAAAILRARAYLERGENKQAWATTRQLAARRDANASTLFLHARACRAAHAWVEEAETLERIISLVARTGAPTAAYKVYLGQALSAAGRSDEALRTLREAADDPALPEAQREFVATAIRRLQESQTPLHE